MARDKDGKIVMKAYDDLFKNDEERAEDKLPKIRDIPLSEIDDFPNHPFRVIDDEDMINLMESIKERGVITPATIRKKPDGRYEMVSGHRRKHACENLGLETLRCEVVELSRDEATILMVESNYQRSEILPSEKAFAYKMRAEALNRRGKRTDLTYSPVDNKFTGTTANEIGKELGDSQAQVFRYIRLTELVPELLEFVDEGKMKMRPAVEISYLDEDSQRDIVDMVDLLEATPSHAQAIRMRAMFNNGDLDTDMIQQIMAEQKPNQKEKIVLKADKVRSLIPKSVAINKTEEYILKALEYYGDYLKNRDDRNAR